MNATETRGFAVDCRDVVITPPGQPDHKILDGISLTVQPGEVVGIVGGNGTGKSSLLAAIAGELSTTSGEIKVGGRRIDGPINQRIDGVGFVHQNDEDDLLLAYSVAMNIAFRQINNGCHPNKFFACTRRYKSKIAKMIAEHSPGLRVDIDDLMGNLSGGQRQMVNLVTAIHIEHENNPCRLILLDEHTSRLDHLNEERVMRYTFDNIRETRTTALIVTHRYRDALKCDRIVILGRGKVADQILDPGSIDADKLKERVAHAATDKPSPA